MHIYIYIYIYIHIHTHYIHTYQDYTQVHLQKHIPVDVNLLAPELFFFNFSTPVYKMGIIQEPNTLEL